MRFGGVVLRISLLSALSMGLNGCLLGPNFHSPAAPQVNGYAYRSLPYRTANTPMSGNSGKAQYFCDGQDIPAQWWEIFHSPALDQLVRIGLANSPTLAAAQATLGQAEENFNAQVGSTLYPQLNATLSGERQRETAGQLVGTTGGRATIFNTYNATVSVSYNLDVFGASHRQIEAQEAQVNFQAFQLEAAYLTLTSNIVTTAITIASLQGQIQATQALILAQEEQLRIVSEQFHLGGASGADILTQENQVAATRATLPPLEQQLEKEQDALAVLVGAFPSDCKIPDFNLESLNLPQDLPVSLPSNLVRQRPDIRAQEALLHAASAQVGVATANLFPQITLTGLLGFTSPTLSNLFTKDNELWNYGGSLLQPIFQGGALRAKRRAAIDAYQQAAAQYKQTVLQGFQNVADTLQALQNDALELQAQQEAASAAYGALVLTQKQYKLGGVSYINLLNAQRTYQQARINLIQAKAARFTDTAALFTALGGGWWNHGCLPDITKAVNGNLSYERL